ncbi:hypothetical protein IMSHALPRED_004404 [Imshaugia aleurites]|uniref:Uncharacterized protein n=1 Tax=Imshaugia aleurites TaxID=172621 RepID=A0A8H3I8F1_9LECA|nr:hypothetical protein IMSHALPRED_004404 [Imshaugia aleurites]
MQHDIRCIPRSNLLTSTAVASAAQAQRLRATRISNELLRRRVDHEAAACPLPHHADLRYSIAQSNPAHEMINIAMDKRVNQVLELRYIDKGILSQMLTKLFPKQWNVEDQGDHCLLIVPRKLTEDEIKLLQKQTETKRESGQEVT